MPYICKSLTPYISSNRNHCSAVSGAVEQLISRRVGKSFPPPPGGGRSARASGPGGGDSASACAASLSSAAPLSPHPGLPPAVRPSPSRGGWGGGRGGGLFSSILRTVGTPAANVIPYCRIQSKKRLWEKRLAMCMVSPFSKNGIRLSTCAEFQPKERYSSVRSFSERLRNSR